MLWLERLLLALPWLRRKREQSLAEELDSHLAMAAEEAAEEGLSKEEARYFARRDLGSPLRIKEDARREWLLPALERAAQDLRYAVRTLRQAPLFTSVAVASLALGIGSATAIFSIVDGILLKPLGYPQSDRLVFIQEFVPGLSRVYPLVPVNSEHFHYWRAHTKSFASIAAVESDGTTFTGAGEPAELHGLQATSDLFPTLGIQMEMGRGILPAEDKVGNRQVVVISDAFWRSRFGARSDVVGQRILLDSVPATIVGVLPSNFHFPKGRDLGALSGLGKSVDFIRPLQNPVEGWDGDYDLLCFGRLQTGVTEGQALAELNTLTAQFTKQYAVVSEPRPALHLLKDAIADPVKQSLAMLLAGVLALLLIVCLNLANLTLARASVRRREFSIRTALGAGQVRLLQQVMTETFALAVLGGALGLALASAALRLFVATAPVSLPRLDEVSLDARVVAFAIVLIGLCAVLCGLIPALRIARSEPQDALKSGSRAAGVQKQSLRHREWLIGAEVGLSLVLLFIAGLLTSSMYRILHIDKGFTQERAFAIDLSLPDLGYPRPEDRNQFFNRLLTGVRDVPGVESSALVLGLPLTGESYVNSIELNGTSGDWIGPANSNSVLINVRYISPDYFSTLGIPLVRGAIFNAHDLNRHVTVISERLAAKVWPGQNPIGKRFKTGSGAGQVEVIGVVKDVHNGRLNQDATLIAYMPYGLRSPGYGSLVVRTRSDPQALMEPIRKLIWSLDSRIPVPPFVTIAQLVDQSVATERFQMRLCIAFGCAALCLSLIGIYGVVAYHVSTRRAEIGIRLALGAGVDGLVRLMMWQGLRPTLIGLAAGLAVSFASGWAVRSLLFGVRFLDPLSLFAAACLMLITGSLACLIPARAAARVAPSSALRYE